jgi:hypothetical protein
MTIIKNTLGFFYLLVAAGIMLSLPALIHAQESEATTSEAILLADVNVQNCLLNQNERTLTIDCDFINNGSIQSGIKYAVMLVSGEGEEQVLVDQTVYDETFTLKQGEKLHKTITYPVPPYINGVVAVWINASNKDGLLLAQNRLGLTAHATVGDTALIRTNLCYLTIAGDTTNTKYTLDQGVDIRLTEKLLGHCMITNQGTTDLTLTPTFATHYRNIFGDIVETPTVLNAPITIPPGKAAQYTFGLPHPQTPQAYDTVVTLTSNNQPVSNQAVFHYVIKGASATIQTLSLDKISYTNGQTAVVTTTWTGSADSFPNSRLGGTQASALLINTTIYSGDTMCGELSQPAGTSTSLQNLSLYIPMITDCPYPVVTVRLLGTDNQILAERTLVANEPAATDTTTNSNLKTYLLYGLGALLLILLMVAIFFMIKKRRNTPPDMPMTTPIATLFLMLMIGTSLFLGGVNKAEAITFSHLGKNYTINLNKSEYSTSEAIGVTMSVIYPICTNGANSGWGIKALNVPNGELYNYRQEAFNGPTGRSSYSETKNTTFTAPGNSGNYQVNYNGGENQLIVGSCTGTTTDWSCSDIYGCWEYEIQTGCQYSYTPSVQFNTPYTVPGAPAPTASLSASPSSITAGNSSTLTYSCGNSATASIDNGVMSSNSTLSDTKSVSPSDTTVYTLTCTNSGGNSTQAQTTVTVSAAPVNGSCNNSTANSCTAGSFSDRTDTGTTYEWSCNGSNGGTSATNCSMTIPTTPVNGSCNNSTQNSCSTGSFSDRTDTGTTYEWSCNGSNGGTNATNCSMTIPTGGSCPDSDNADVSVTGATSGSVWGSGPYTRDSNIGVAAVHAGLITSGQSATIRKTSAGTLSSFTGSTAHGVTTSSYSSPWCAVNLSLVSIYTSVISGSCGTTNNACNSGTLSDTTDDASYYRWSCNGSGGGASPSCSLAKAVATSFSCTASPASIAPGGTVAYTTTGPNLPSYRWVPSDYPAYPTYPPFTMGPMSWDYPPDNSLPASACGAVPTYPTAPTYPYQYNSQYNVYEADGYTIDANATYFAYQAALNQHDYVDYPAYLDAINQYYTDTSTYNICVNDPDNDPNYAYIEAQAAHNAIQQASRNAYFAAVSAWNSGLAVYGYSNNSSRTFTAAAPGTYGMIAYLQATTQYGTAVCSNVTVSTVTIPTQPSNPTFQSASCGGNITTLWSAVSGATSYNLQYKPSSDSTWTSLNGATSPRNISSLTPGTSYDFQVQAVNSAGASAWSAYGTGSASAACVTTAAITAPSCTITSGQSTCTTPVTWTSSNTTNPISVRQNNNEFATNAIQSTATTRTLTFGAGNPLNTFTFRHNNGILLHTITPSANCINGTSWNSTSGICTVDPADPNINLTITPAQLVRHGATAYVSWETTEYAGLSCRVVGPGIDSIEFDKTNEPTPPVTAKMVYTMTCTALGARWTDTATVESVGEIEEI